MLTARRSSLFALTAVCALLGTLASGSFAAPALAAEPLERPEAQAPFEVKGHSAFLFGILDPGKPSGGGPFALDTYDFIYRATTGGECEGAGQLQTLEKNSLGFGHEEVAEQVETLSGGTEYAVCLIAHNGSESATSAPVTFKTPIPPETPVEEHAVNVTVTEATLEGTLNAAKPGEPGSYEFIYSESPSECKGAGQKATFAESNGEQAEHAEATVTELLPHGNYTFCLLARNQAGETSIGPPETFTTALVKPVIQGAEAINVTAGSAELTAKIAAEGDATEYRVEYGTSTGYGTTVPAPPAPEPSIGEGRAPVLVTQRITGLEQGVSYHWRIVATNAAGTTTGADHTFAYETPGPTLPDGRAYEMVTPVHKNDAAIGYKRSGTPISISEDGTRLIAGALQCFAEAGSCDAIGSGERGEPFLFSRASNGWSATALAPPASEFNINGELSVNATTGDALFNILSPSTEAFDFYVRRPVGSFEEIGPQFENGADGYRAIGVTATGDFGHLVFESTGEPWPSLSPAPADLNGRSLFEYTGTGNASPRMVAVTGGAGSESLIGVCSNYLGDGRNQEPGQLSANGDVVFFTVATCEQGGTGENAARPVPTSELFARVDASRTVAISEPSAFSAAAPYPGCTEEPCVRDVNDAANWLPGTFITASADGTKVLFESEQRLLDSAQEGAPNLYEYDLSQPGAPLTDLSAGDKSGSGPGFAGLVADSADGSHVYFVAQGVLDENANTQGETAQSGAENLYDYQHEGTGGHVTFIAQLAEGDQGLWGRPQGISASVTPDGGVLVFPSHARLTPDTGDSGDAQVFRYEAATEQMVRLSAGRHGFDDNGNAGVGDASIAAHEGKQPAGPWRGDLTMSADGSYVFFQSPKALTPGALNDVQIGVEERETHFPIYAQNIYEWHAGEVSLISDGRDTRLGGSETSDVQLLGSDATGANVFFETSDPLVPEDIDTQADIYDARVCSAVSPCSGGQPSTETGCSGEECHGIPAAAPPLLTPGSASFNGAGNLALASKTAAGPRSKLQTRAQKLAKALHVCRKKAERKLRRACERQAEARFGSKVRAKNNDRRTRR